MKRKYPETSSVMNSSWTSCRNTGGDDDPGPVSPANSVETERKVRVKASPVSEKDKNYMPSVGPQSLRNRFARALKKKTLDK